MVRSVVDLPAALAPISDTTSPAPIESEMSRKTGRLPYCTLMFPSSSMLASEIGIDHRRVTENRRGRAFGDLAAVMHGDGAVGETAEEADLVVDDAECGAVPAQVAQHGIKFWISSWPSPVAGSSSRSNSGSHISAMATPSIFSLP